MYQTSPTCSSQLSCCIELGIVFKIEKKKMRQSTVFTEYLHVSYRGTGYFSHRVPAAARPKRVSFGFGHCCLFRHATPQFAAFRHMFAGYMYHRINMRCSLIVAKSFKAGTSSVSKEKNLPVPTVWATTMSTAKCGQRLGAVCTCTDACTANSNAWFIPSKTRTPGINASYQAPYQSLLRRLS
jgi:hypothetical protein